MMLNASVSADDDDDSFKMCSGTFKQDFLIKFIHKKVLHTNKKVNGFWKNSTNDKRKEKLCQKKYRKILLWRNFKIFKLRIWVFCL